MYLDCMYVPMKETNKIGVAAMLDIINHSPVFDIARINSATIGSTTTKVSSKKNWLFKMISEKKNYHVTCHILLVRVATRESLFSGGGNER